MPSPPAAGDVATVPLAAAVANLGHDLRSPLNAIIGFSEILQAELFGPLGGERYRVYAQDIATAGRRLLWIIDRLLDAAHGETGATRAATVRAADLVAELASQAEARGAPVRVCVADLDLALFGDAAALYNFLDALLASLGAEPGMVVPAEIGAVAEEATVRLWIDGGARSARLGEALHDPKGLTALFRAQIERTGATIAWEDSAGRVTVRAPRVMLDMDMPAPAWRQAV